MDDGARCSTMNPRIIGIVILCAALLSLAGAIYIGADLYRGLVKGSFALVRAEPITQADGFRYKLIAFGESLAVLVLLGCTVLMLKVFAVFRKS
jgi:hypothetical protein